MVKTKKITNASLKAVRAELKKRSKPAPKSKPKLSKGAATGRILNPNSTTNVKFTKPKPTRGKVEQLCAVTDPFCSHAIGARLPDGGTLPTLTSVMRGYTTMVTAATGGCCALQIQPNNSGYCLNGTNSTTTSCAFNSTCDSLQGNNMVVAYGYQSRIISMGFVLRAVQNATAAQGQFTVVQGQNLISGTTYDVTDLTYPQVSTVCNYAGMTYTHKIAPANQTLAAQFTSRQSNNSSSQIIGWPTVMIGYTGGSAGAQTVCTVEYYLHIEWIVSAGNDIGVLAVPPPPLNPKLLQAKSVVDSQHSWGREHGPTEFSAAVSKTAINVASKIDWSGIMEGLAETFMAAI